MIPPAECDAGLLAYEQVQAFASLRRKKLPLIYAGFDLLVLAGAAAMALAGWPIFATILAVVVVLLGGYSWWNWKRLGERDVVNRALLARLQTQYGEELPWLQVERQLAEIRRIEAEHGTSPQDPSS